MTKRSILQSNLPPPTFLAELTAKATALGYTEEKMCQRLGISHSHFSRWRRGLRTAPDPRLRENKGFYLSVAEFLERDLGQILAEILFLDPEEEKQLSRWVFETISHRKASLVLPQLSKEDSMVLEEILLNLPGREKVLPVILEGFRTYVTTVLSEVWFKSLNQVIKPVNTPNNSDES